MDVANRFFCASPATGVNAGDCGICSVCWGGVDAASGHLNRGTCFQHAKTLRTSLWT